MITININCCVILVLLFLVCSGCQHKVVSTFDEFYIPPDEIKLLEQKAEKGDVKSAEKLVNYYRFVDKKPEKIIKYLTIKAESGDAATQYSLACCLLKSNNQIEHEQGIYWLKISANAGELYAQSYLAQLYEKGDIIEGNYCDAKYWYEKVAYRGGISAMLKIVDFNKNGKCVEENNIIAFAWLLIAESFAKNSNLQKDIKDKQNRLLAKLSNNDLKVADETFKRIHDQVIVSPEFLNNEIGEIRGHP